jgi:glutamate-1-semialdehyde 2,1-aminomutase
MYAMRLARAFTGRDKILKFEGGYHGMSAEAQMSLAPARLVNFPQAVPDSAGIPEAVRDGVLVAPFNDAGFVRSLIAEHSGQIAGIIVEPLQRLIPPAPGFLETLRTECDRHGIVPHFRRDRHRLPVRLWRRAGLYGVTPDICTLGKIIGGGFPLAAIAGRADIMAHFDKAKVGQGGFLMQLGTLSGNPVAAVAGLKTLEILRRPGAYEGLRQTGQTLMELIGTHLAEAGIAHQIVGDPTLFDVIFSDRPVRDYRDVLQADAGRNAAFNKALRGAGVFKSPGKLYPSLAIDDQDLEWTDRAVREAAAKVRLA